MFCTLDIFIIFIHHKMVAIVQTQRKQRNREKKKQRFLLVQLKHKYQYQYQFSTSSSSSLTVSRTRLPTVGDRAFPVATARVWNSLPDLVTSTPSVAVFQSRLKTPV